MNPGIDTDMMMRALNLFDIRYCFESNIIQDLSLVDRNRLRAEATQWLQEPWSDYPPELASILNDLTSEGM